MSAMIVSEEEHCLLNKLRDKLKDITLTPEDHQDKNFVRWLRARKHNLVATEHMIRNDHLWRKENDIDQLVFFENPNGWGVNRIFSWYICGVSKENNPVHILPYREWEPIRYVFANGQRSDLVSYCTKACELQWRACVSASSGRNSMGQMIFIYDCTGLGWSHVSSIEVIKHFMEMAKTAADHYPEMIRQNFVLNASITFQFAFKFVRAILDERTLNKITVLGSDPEEWRREIGKLVPYDQFPKKYGGDGDDDLKMSINSDGTLI